jgi:tRNA nucleotidyltransferase/poly(A) polymerase
LRTESYSIDSRIPDIQIGSPAEDAYRRDLTINSMFYNVNKGIIEDFTNMGIEDLKAGIIRTPLPPITTLRDDPLRVLRVIRFACRYNFEIVNELEIACNDKSVKESLQSKVSRERILSELDRMLLSDNYLRAILLLYKSDLLPSVIVIPENKQNLYSKINFDNNEENKDKINEFNPYLTISNFDQYFDYGLCSAFLCNYLSINIESNIESNQKINKHISEMNNKMNMLLNSNKYYSNTTGNGIIKENEKDKLYRYSAICSGGIDIIQVQSNKIYRKLKYNEIMLQKELKMKIKDIQGILSIQTSSIPFTNMINNILTNNFKNELDNEYKIIINNDLIPCFGSINRVELGMSIRASGTLLPYAIKLACNQSILYEIKKEILFRNKDINFDYSLLLDNFLSISDFSYMTKFNSIIDDNNREENNNNIEGVNKELSKDEFISIVNSKIQLVTKSCSFILLAIEKLDVIDACSLQPFLDGVSIKQVLLLYIS